jgi:hypothetical protein
LFDTIIIVAGAGRCRTVREKNEDGGVVRETTAAVPLPLLAHRAPFREGLFGRVSWAQIFRARANSSSSFSACDLAKP